MLLNFNLRRFRQIPRGLWHLIAWQRLLWSISLERQISKRERADAKAGNGKCITIKRDKDNRSFFW